MGQKRGQNPEKSLFLEGPDPLLDRFLELDLLGAFSFVKNNRFFQGPKKGPKMAQKSVFFALLSTFAPRRK